MSDTRIVFERELTPVDYLMLRGEDDPRARTAGLSVALLDRVPDFERLKQTFDRASRVVLRLRQRVVVPALPVTSPRWVVDPDFDLGFHVRRLRIAGAGTLREVLDFGQTILASRMDTARPLWEVHLVEGVHVDGSEAALVMKMNHAVTDGLGGVELFKQIFDFDRDVDRGPLPPLPVPEDVSPTDLVREAARRAPIAGLSTVTRRVVRTTDAIARSLRAPMQSLADARSMVASIQRVLGPPPAPPSPLLRRRGLGRRLEVHEFPLAVIRRAAKSAGCSINDAYIAAVCGALRRYHEALGAPVDSLPLAIPVSIRSDDDPAGGNRFAGAQLAAPLGERDPVARMQTVRQDVLTAVAEPAMTALQSVAPLMSHLPWPLLSTLSSVAPAPDVQASNIPGYPEPPYIAGAKIEKQFGFGPLPGVAVMVVLMSLGGTCFVGVHYDTASVSDHEMFARCLREGFDEVLALDPERDAGGGRSAAAKRRAARVTRTEVGTNQ